MKRLGFDLSWSLTKWLFAEAYLREIFAIPPRREFSIIKYASGSVIRSIFAPGMAWL